MLTPPGHFSAVEYILRGGDMDWKDKPTKPGCYWWATSHDVTFCEVDEHGQVFIIGDEMGWHLSMVKGFFYGPLRIPKKKQLLNLQGGGDGGMVP